MGLRQQGSAWENGQQMKEAAFPRRKQTKQRMHSALRQPLAPCPLPLAPCPSPEATHNKAKLNNKDVTTNQGVGQGEGCCGVGSLGRKAWHKEHQKEMGGKKKTTKEKRKNRCPAPALGPCSTSPPEATHDPASSERFKTIQRKRAAGGARWGGGWRAAGRWLDPPRTLLPHVLRCSYRWYLSTLPQYL